MIKSQLFTIVKKSIWPVSLILLGTVNHLSRISIVVVSPIFVMYLFTLNADWPFILIPKLQAIFWNYKNVLTFLILQGSTAIRYCSQLNVKNDKIKSIFRAKCLGSCGGMSIRENLGARACIWPLYNDGLRAAKSPFIAL